MNTIIQKIKQYRPYVWMTIWWFVVLSLLLFYDIKPVWKQWWFDNQDKITNISELPPSWSNKDLTYESSNINTDNKYVDYRWRAQEIAYDLFDKYDKKKFTEEDITTMLKIWLRENQDAIDYWGNFDVELKQESCNMRKYSAIIGKDNKSFTWFVIIKSKSWNDIVSYLRVSNKSMYMWATISLYNKNAKTLEDIIKIIYDENELEEDKYKVSKLVLVKKTADKVCREFILHSDNWIKYYIEDDRILLQLENDVWDL